ncbi:MAG: heat shock protein transcriptional repressor HspR [Armatimonadota bacterium]
MPRENKGEAAPVEVNKDEPLYMISVAAKLCDLHPQTLRMYERLGLVRPARISSKNRVYSQADIERLRQIQRLTQDMGVNLAGVEVILDLLDKMQKMQESMQSEIDRLRRIMEEQAKRLEDFSRS